MHPYHSGGTAADSHGLPRRSSVRSVGGPSLHTKAKVQLTHENPDVYILNYPKDADFFLAISLFYEDIISIKGGVMNQMILAIVIALTFILGGVRTSLADLRWRCTKTYTAALADGAKDAAVAVGEQLQNLQDAAEYIGNAQTVVQAAEASAVGTTVAGAKILGAASGTLTAAGEAVAATTVVAVKGVAVGAAAVVGTAVGQGAGWLLSACWDPVCGIQALDLSVDDIYSPATEAEVQSLIPELVLLATGQTMTVSGFENAGTEGEAALQFLSESTGMFLNLARGAASATAGQYDETLNAVDDLTQQLADFPATVATFADAVQSITLSSPAQAVHDEKTTYLAYLYGNEYQTDSSNTMAQAGELGLDPTDALTTVEDAAFGAANALGDALTVLDAGTYSPLVTSGDTQGFFNDLTLDDFNQFVSDCAANGSACLPSEEISIVTRLIEAAGVTIPDIDIGTSIADYDATDDYCDDSAEVAALQIAAASVSPLKATASGALTIADVLDQSITDASTGETSTSWMDVDLEDSPVTIAAREATGEEAEGEGTTGCSLADHHVVAGPHNGGLLLSMGFLGLLIFRYKRS